MKAKNIIPAWAAALAAAVLALCLLALPAGAAETDSGTCGSDAVWVLEDDGTLTISGTGKMKDWTYATNVPWYDYRETITEVVIEEGITSIGDGAFYGCTALADISIPDSVTVIGDSAFRDCSSLTEITLPEGATELGYRAFYGCSSLTGISIPESVSSIGSSAFAYCSSLTEITIPEGITELLSATFDGCTSLKSVTIPASVTAIEKNTFRDCSALESITLPDSLTSLEYGIFVGCTSLREISIPGSVTEIGDRAFEDCTSLESITIPEAVTSIGARAFYYCTALTTVVFSGSAPEIAENAFTRVTADVFYPEDDSTWTEETMQDYGGSLSWISYGIGTEEFVSYSFTLYSGTEELISAQLVSGSTVDLDSAAAPEKEGYTLAGWMDRDCTLYDGEITITGDLELYAAWTPEEDTASEDSTLLISLDSGELDYTSSRTVTMQIANEERNGIYFLSGETLGFYSLDYYGYVTAYVFDGCDSAYVEGDMLYVLDGFSCYVYDLNGNTLDRTISFDDLESEESAAEATAVGVDPSGRLYVATEGEVDEEDVYSLWLFSPEGTLLSSTEVENYVYSFDGFEEESGYFFMESRYNWIYFGYDHYGHALTMGVVEEDTISYMETSSSDLTQGVLVLNYDCLEYLCQNTYYRHQTSAALLDGHYLVTTSVTNGRVQVIDTETFDTLLSISRAAIEEDQSSTTHDLNSIGVRAVYHESNDSIILYENGRILNEYDPETGEITGSYDTACYVFNLLIMGDQVIAIEKEDGEYCLEIVDWSTPEEFEIQAESDTMQVGESQQLTAEGAAYSTSYTWSSSDETILSVTDSGLVSAWSEGEATISYTSLDGSYEAEYTIQVSGTLADSEPEAAVLLSGGVSDNLSANNISTYYSRTVNSYLYENEDGTLTRVEYVSGTGVLVEVLDPSDGSTLSSMTLDMELPIWGGFYSGEEYNYLVFGQANYGEDDDVEVIRVVKYSRDWERLDSCSICGANTYEPFEAGSLRMTEAGGNLYLYTCHTMYEESDGYNHQANMTFVLDEDSMEVVDSYYDVMNISYGYVSHSFNQFIQTDGEYLYRVDLGDAAPRAVSITKTAVGDDVTDLDSYTYALSIGGSYASNGNYTGVSIGGFELSTDNCLIVGNSVDQDSDDYSTYGQRNIFLLVTDQDYLETEVIWLTDYEESDGITPRTPQLVKITDDQFLLLWEEEDSSGEVTTRMVTLNGDGDLTSDIITSDVRLSDCQPIVTEDRIVTWYVTDGDTAVLYQLNPYTLSENSGYDSCLQDDSCPISQFTDADPTAWYHDGVHFCLDEGLMNGTSSITFEPSTATTRNMIVTMLYRMAGSPEVEGTSSFTDVVAGSWYEDAVIWAEQTGIAKGYDTGEFGVSDPVTREQIATFFCRYAEIVEGQDVSASADLSVYPDEDEVSSWAYAELSWAVSNGLITGQGVGDETYLAPGSDAARSETATILMRFMENVL